MNDRSGGRGCFKGAMGCAGVGCFLVLGMVALGIAFGPQLREMLKMGLETVADTPVYHEALARATADPRVTEKLGEPIETEIPSRINIHRGSGGTEMEMDIGIEGPQGEAELEVRGSERGDEVVFEVLRVRIGGEWIDLLREGPAAPKQVEATDGDG